MATATEPKNKPAAKTARAVDVKVLPISKIVVLDGFNPRTLLEETALADLADSIAERGLLQALAVKPIANGKYQVIDGHRRHAAATRAGVKEVPCTIRDADSVDELVDAVVSNQHREDHTPLDEALAYDRLRNLGLTQKGIAEKVGVSEKLVADRLVIADLPKKLRDRFHHDWPTSAARPLARIVAVGKAGEKFAIAMADWLDKEAAKDRANGYRGATAHSFAKDPLNVATSFAEKQPGVTVVHAKSKPGGGFHLPGRYMPGRHQAIDPQDLKLPKAAKDQVNAMNSGVTSWDRYVIVTDTGVLDALNASGVLLRFAGHNDVGLCFDEALLVELVVPIIDQDFKDRAKAKAAQSRSAPKSAGAQEKADEKAKEEARQLAAHEYNLKLGEQLAKFTKGVDLNLDAAKWICRTALMGSEMGRSNVHQLAGRGLRYVLPQWQQVIEMRNGKTRIRYPGDGTKNPDKTGAATNADRDLDELFWEWWELANTPQEVLGRTLVAFAAAHYADQLASPASRRIGSSAYLPYEYADTPSSNPAPSGIAKDALEHLKALVAKTIPNRQRAPKQKPAAKKPAAKAAKKPAAKTGVSQTDINAMVDDAAKTAGDAKPAAAKTSGASNGLLPGSATLRRKAVEHITAQPGIGIPELSEKLGVKQNQLYAVLPALETDGQIEKLGRGWHPKTQAAAT